MQPFAYASPGGVAVAFLNLSQVAIQSIHQTGLPVWPPANELLEFVIPWGSKNVPLWFHPILENGEDVPESWHVQSVIALVQG